MLMILFSILSYFDRTIMSVAGPGMMRDFHLTETKMGIVYSSFLFGYALAMIPGGYFADEIGPWRTLTFMGFGAASFTALTALGATPGLGSLLGVLLGLSTIRFLMGVCTAPLYPSCGRMNANWFPVQKRGFIWGLVAAGAGIGSALSPSLFAWMIPTFGWRASFGMAGLATAVVALFWLWTVRDYPAGGPHQTHYSLWVPGSEKRRLQAKDFVKLLRNRNVLLLSIGYCTVGYFEYIFFFWIYYYFGQIRGMSTAQTSIYTTAIFLSWVVMTPLGGWISDKAIKKLGERFGRPFVPVSGMILGALFLLFGTQLTSPFGIGASLAIAFGLVSSSDGSFWSATIQSGGTNAGAACGILNTGSNIGGFVAPVLTPMIAAALGWSAALYAACGVVIVGSAIWFLMAPSHNMKQPFLQSLS
jgi:sugar phosphate permease